MTLFARLSRQTESPPVWLVAMIALAAAQAAWMPLWPGGPALRAIGLVLVVAGIILMALAFVPFARLKTTILPREVPGRLITTGVYGVSRNPIYLADMAILTGLVLRWDAGALPLVALFGWVLTTRFIRGEEAGCAAAFGPAWDAYAARVRRWL
jgi:protein-S-isoprenylcysteine O-methyltransferase Ste14